MIRKALALTLGVLALCGTANGQRIYITGVFGNDIWVANGDGSGQPTLLFDEATDDSFGPTGLVVVLGDVDRIFFGAGNSPQIRAANIDGSGAPEALWVDGGNEHIGLTADPTTGQLYWTTQGAGRIYRGAWDGSGTITAVVDGLIAPPSGITIDPASQTLFWTSTFHNGVFAGGADGRPGPRLLYSATDGVSGPRQIAYQNGQIYWTEHRRRSPRDPIRIGRILRAPADGSGPITQLYEMPQAWLPWGIDVSGDRLYWTEFGRSGATSTPDRIMVGRTDGGAAPEVLHSGEFGYVRGIAAGANLITPSIAAPPPPIAIPSMSLLALLGLTLLLPGFAVVRISKLRKRG